MALVKKNEKSAKLFAHVKPKNHKFLKRLTKKENVSLSNFVDDWLDRLREHHAGTKKSVS